jgi:hypothetical protein
MSRPRADIARVHFVSKHTGESNHKDEGRDNITTFLIAILPNNHNSDRAQHARGIP